MATFEQEEAVKIELKQLLNGLSQINAKDLIRTDELGRDFNFEPGVKTFGKLIILSALYYALVWSAKNYNAHQHNYVINKHRQNCLNTFETFVKATGNDIDTKNAVLLQTTQSIFSVQASGHVHGESDGESPNKIIEVMRSVKMSGQKT